MIPERFIFVGRRLSTFSPLLKRFDSFNGLKESISTRKVEGEDSLLMAFKDIFTYADSSSSKEFKNIKALTKTLMESQRSIQQDTLRQVLLLKPPSTLVAPLLDSYNAIAREPVKKPLAEIAVRRCLWEADIHNAVKVVDLTVASPPYLKIMTERRNSTIMKSLVVVLTAGGAMHYGIGLLDLPSTAGVFAMVATYVLNLSFFGYVAFGGKFIGNVKNIKWESGVPLSHMYTHADELTVLSKIAEADIKINGHDGHVSDGFKNAMEARRIKPILPETEQLLEEYWLTGGENFEWVEPDQDPADIIWRRHIGTKKVNLLRDSVKWTDKFIAAKSQESSDSSQTPKQAAY